ncbi:LytR/AlgR family response regulator transcription factor [Fuscibacter oryzae]|uniref:Response regulator transcription factor n=1 Tax=Fuscibacter oryzae TaxID=2803939 RepID=A0A8J7MU58_9RHOB|nr:LytTR family DNA-binding domain-containing protein [Fuscibacter oryzae]MBL4928478.1 response regulator transcription factor [Fuscibacter oryzae]
MSGVSVLVVDDEPLARRRLIRLMAKLDWITRIDEAADAPQARQMAAALRPDILVLDIQMPGGSGFDVLDGLTPVPPALLFVTAFDDQALRAFVVNAIDYVTKPVEPGRFVQAMERARKAATQREQTDRLAEMQETVAALKRALSERGQRATEFWVRVRGDYLRVSPEAVLRFQAERDYVRIHVAGADYLHQESLSSLERRLDPAEFPRVHRSTIIRRSAIARVRQLPLGGLAVVLTDGSEIRVGRTYLTAFRAGLARQIP